MKAAKKLFRRLLKSQAGMSLIETAAVIAITATIAAVVTPIALDKVGDAKVQSAKEDCSQIKSAITSFYSGTGNYPAVADGGDTLDYYTVLRSGDFDQDADELNATKDPNVSDASTWTDNDAHVDLLKNHLIYDNPGESSLTGTGTAGYSEAKITWKGPYMPNIDKQDPWGHNYLVYIRAAQTAQTDSSTGKKMFPWIISAGPNGQLETSLVDNKPGGDDVGTLLDAKQTGGYAASNTGN